MYRILLLLITPVLALRTLEPPPPESISRNTPVEGWVTVRMNHFDASNTDTFQMRYYYNNEFVGREPQIVIVVGGEWSISPSWVTGGLPFQLAQRIGAGIFYTEHRYYGLTRPTNTTSVSELRFLNVDQALGDLAQFIQYIKSDEFDYGRFRDSKVGLAGCSYAGSMATWMRLGYPHLVTAAFSDSGPLHAQEDFPEYLEVIAEAIRVQGGETCLSTIEEAMEGIMELLQTPTGVQRVSELFNTCTLLQASSPLDLATFFWFGITETFAYLVQYATPGNIPDACQRLTNTTLVPGDAVERLAAWITSQPWTQPCIECRYSEQVAAHTNISYDAAQSTMRLWTYQTCVEYGWYQTTTSRNQPFLSTIPLGYFHQMCRDFFNTGFTQELLQTGIERTNNLFAGLTHLPDQVVSAVGGHDPWSPMGPFPNHGRDLAPVYLVDGTSHCRAIRALGSSETEQLEETKRMILAQMQNWMSDMPGSAHAAAVSCLSPLLAVSVLMYTLL